MLIATVSWSRARPQQIDTGYLLLHAHCQAASPQLLHQEHFHNNTQRLNASKPQHSMGYVQQLTRCAALLLLLGAALATVPGKPTVMDIRGGWPRRSTPVASVSVASAPEAASTSESQDSYGSYESYGVEEREVCLQEVERKSCHTHWVEGCDFDTGSGPGSGCNSNNDDCDCDRVHSFWTSDLACCHDKHDYGYSRGSVGVNDHLWGSGGHGGAVGSCDWTWHYVDDEYNYGSIYITNQINKLGSANAVCYFGSDSHECGGPFCERMVMSLQGNVYRVERVYSYLTRTDTTSTGSGIYKDRVTTCDLADNYIDTSDTGRKAENAKGGANGGANGAKTAIPPAVSTPNPAAAAKPVAQVASGGQADTQSYYGEGHYENHAVYAGRAVVINGIVDNMAGPRKEKWESGVFEYVMGFDTNGQAVSGGLDSATPWIRDKAYKFTFYKQATYGY